MIQSFFDTGSFFLSLKEKAKFEGVACSTRSVHSDFKTLDMSTQTVLNGDPKTGEFPVQGITA